jgi:hypothetical protein
MIYFALCKNARLKRKNSQIYTERSIYSRSLKSEIYGHKKIITRHFKPNRFRKPVRFYDAYCPVRDKMSVER